MEGSVARGEPGRYSDVEIFVLSGHGTPATVLYFDEGCFVMVEEGGGADLVCSQTRLFGDREA